jgi:hypothetical protein
MKNNDVTLHIEVDVPCKILYFGNEHMIAEPNKDNVMSLSTGKHKISVESIEYSDLKEEYLLEYSGNLASEILTVSFSNKIKEKQEHEAKRVESLRLIPEKDGELFGYLNIETNHFEIEAQYERAFYFKGGLAKVQKNERFGLINKKGDIIVECIYTELFHSGNGYSIFVDEKGYGIVSDEGELVFPSQEKKIVYYDKNVELIVFQEKNSYGLMDLEANEFDIKINNIPYFNEKRAAIKQDGKWGHINTKCEITTPCKYDYAHTFKNGHALVGFYKVEYDDGYEKEYEEEGYVDLDGKEIISTIYRKLTDEGNGIIIGKKTKGYDYNYEYDLLNYKGEIVANSSKDIQVKEGIAEICQEDDKYSIYPEYKYYYMTIDGNFKEYMPIEKLDNGNIKIKKDGKYGIYGDNRIIIPCEYDDLKYINDIVLARKNIKHYIFRSDGKFILERNELFFRIYEFAPGILEVVANANHIGSVFGLLKNDGIWLLPLEYNRIRRFGNYILVTDSQKKEGIIDDQGNIIHECVYDDIITFSTEDESNYFFIRSINDIVEILDGQGKIILECQCDKTKSIPQFQYISDDVAFIKHDNGWTAINQYGNTLFTLNNSNEIISSYKENFAIIKCNKNFFFINKIGTILHVNYPILDCKPFSEGLAAVKFEEGWNYIDANGNIISKDYYGDAQSFSEGLAAVKSKKNQKWGFIDINGNEIIECRFTGIESSFHSGYAYVTKEEDNGWNMKYYEDDEGKTYCVDNRYYFNINKCGNYCKYPFYDGLALYEQKNGRYTYVNKYGISTGVSFTEASNFINGRAKVKRKGREYYIDVSMNEIE